MINLKNEDKIIQSVLDNAVIKIIRSSISLSFESLFKQVGLQF